MFPKRAYPVITTVLPSTGKNIRFRPMQAREEKLLLLAKSAGDEVLSSVKQVVRNCLLDTLDVDRAPIFDVEWLFIRIRIASVGGTSEVSYVDPSDGKTRDFEVDLEKVEVVRPPAEDKVDLGSGVVVQLRWPGVADYVYASEQATDDASLTSLLVLASVDKVYDGDKVVDARKQPHDELVEFIDSLELDHYHKILSYLSATPRLHYSIKYETEEGEREIVLSRLSDFFTFV